MMTLIQPVQPITRKFYNICEIFTREEIQEMINLFLYINTCELSKKLLIDKIEKFLSVKVIITEMVQYSSRYLLFEVTNANLGTLKIIYDTLKSESLDFITNDVLIVRIYLDNFVIDYHTPSRPNILELINLYLNKK